MSGLTLHVTLLLRLFSLWLVSLWFAIPVLPVHCRNYFSASSSPGGNIWGVFFFSDIIYREHQVKKMSSRFSPSRELFKVCFGRRLSTPQMQSLGPNKFRQRWKIPASWQWIIHTSGELAMVYHWHWKDKRSASCWVIKRGVWLAVRYISNQWPGWAGKSNLLMGLMECEMLKEKQPLAVCPLHLATDIATHIEGHSGLISGRSWYPSSLECGKKMFAGIPYRCGEISPESVGYLRRFPHTSLGIMRSPSLPCIGFTLPLLCFLSCSTGRARYKGEKMLKGNT